MGFFPMKDCFCLKESTDQVEEWAISIIIERFTYRQYQRAAFYRTVPDEE